MTGHPPPEDTRALWAQNARTVLRIVEAHADLPLPYIGPAHIHFYLNQYGPEARRGLAAAETALNGELGVTFTGAPDRESPHYFDLTASLPGGLLVVIRAYTSDVAEQKVTGQTVTDVTEWVRRPVEPDPAEIGEDDGPATPGEEDQ